MPLAFHRWVISPGFASIGHERTRPRSTSSSASSSATGPPLGSCPMHVAYRRAGVGPPLRPQGRSRRPRRATTAPLTRPRPGVAHLTDRRSGSEPSRNAAQSHHTPKTAASGEKVVSPPPPHRRPRRPRSPGLGRGRLQRGGHLSRGGNVDTRRSASARAAPPAGIWTPSRTGRSRATAPGTRPADRRSPRPLNQPGHRRLNDAAGRGDRTHEPRGSGRPAGERPGCTPRGVRRSRSRAGRSPTGRPPGGGPAGAAPPAKRSRHRPAHRTVR